MAYVKQTWACDDTITAEKLNHMEDGIESANSGGGTLVVKVDHLEGSFPNTYEVYDKTWNEVNSALENNMRVVVQPETPQGNIFQYPVFGATSGNNEYAVGYFAASSNGVSATILYACSADGYLQSTQCDSEGGGGSDATS